MTHRIEILENNTVEIYLNDAEKPFLRQPVWPNQEPWANSEEARSWAEMFVESIEVADAPYAPNGRGEERFPKPTEEQIAEMRARMETPQLPTQE